MKIKVKEQYKGQTVKGYFLTNTKMLRKKYAKCNFNNGMIFPENNAKKDIDALCDAVDIISKATKIIYVEGCHNCFACHEKSITSLTVTQYQCGINKEISYPKMREAFWSGTYPEGCPIKKGLIIKIK